MSVFHFDFCLGTSPTVDLDAEVYGDRSIDAVAGLARVDAGAGARRRPDGVRRRHGPVGVDRLRVTLRTRNRPLNQENKTKKKSFTGFYWVLLGWNGLYWVLQEFFFRLLPSLIRFQWVVLSFTAFFLGFTRFQWFVWKSVEHFTSWQGWIGFE